MSTTHKIEVTNSEKLKHLRRAHSTALDLEFELNELGEPLLATKARKLGKICWYNIERTYREI
jgi:hypothetical protein